MMDFFSWMLLLILFLFIRVSFKLLIFFLRCYVKLLKKYICDYIIKIWNFFFFGGGVRFVLLCEMDVVLVEIYIGSFGWSCISFIVFNVFNKFI